MLYLLCLLVIPLIAAAYRNELILQEEHLVGSVIKKPLKNIPIDQLPKHLDYRERGLLTTDLNQHIPVYCGSCWAHAAMSSIADRIKIANNGTTRDVIPAIQTLINCGKAGTCNGGDSGAANAWVYKNGIPDVTCQYYQAKNMECTDQNICMNCDHDTNLCYPVYKYPTITLSEYGTAYGEEAIMNEIYQRGPVSAYLNALCIEDYTGGINMYDTCEPREVNHAIQINGWGEENGVKYWIGRNSWGTYWGEKGFFRIVRGGNWKLERAFWAVPNPIEGF